MNSALIIFVRNPELGKVKTRIAATEGDAKALDIYNKLLTHTHAITIPLAVDVFVYYASGLADDDRWQEAIFRKRLQADGDLGNRMDQAFRSVFEEGYKRVIIIGSDCFDLTTDVIENAFNRLLTHNAVIGPTFDGGYYLLGTSAYFQSLFENKKWSTNTVFSDTISDFRHLHLNWHKLPVLSDVDTIDDCKRYSQLMTSKP